MLIVDTTVPRKSWQMGRVEGVFKDRKGDTRTCKVRTKSSVLERPTQNYASLLRQDSECLNFSIKATLDN